MEDLQFTELELALLRQSLNMLAESDVYQRLADRERLRILRQKIVNAKPIKEIKYKQITSGRIGRVGYTLK